MALSTTVSIGVIALNEEKYLPVLLHDIEKQTYPHELIEIVLIDSLSHDGTKKVMHNFAHTSHDFVRITVLDNRKKILPAGWNVFLRHARHDVIMRVDAHARLQPDFVEQSIRVLDSGEDVVGGQRPCIIAEDATPWQRTLLAIEESAFGSSPARYRGEAAQARYVDSVFHGAYRKEVFEKIGLYNENLARTEDNDIHYRMRKAGYRIRLDPTIVSYQVARPTLSTMVKQKYGNGYWIGRTLFIQPGCVGLHHLVPGVFISTLLASVLCGIFSQRSRCLFYRQLRPSHTSSGLFSSLWRYRASRWKLFSLVGGAYLFANGAMSIRTIMSDKTLVKKWTIPLLFAIIHGSYGWGTLRGIVDGSMKKITSQEINDESHK